MELLRPDSDLARLAAGFPRVDVLLVAEDTPAPGGDDLDDPDDEEMFPVDEVRERAAALRHPDLVVHRLGLSLPLTAEVEQDLVAALSELVGFDPEPGVSCLTPATADTPWAGGPSGHAAHDHPALDRAARRIARVYGLPLVRYRCLELSAVPD